MKQIAYLTAAALLLVACGKDSGDNAQERRVVTAEATEITMSSAILYGYVNTEYLLLGGESGFIVSTSSTPSLDNGWKVVSQEVDKNGKYLVQVSGLTSSCTYYYLAFLSTGTTILVGEVKSFTTKEFAFAAIDMGLSVKWANANLGATAPEGYGDYYAWGETEPKENYSWSTYKWCNGSYDSLTKYNVYSHYGIVDNNLVLDLEDDVAHVKLAGKWRIPTSGEMYELISTWDNSSYQWELKSLNGHDGWLVTYLVNNNSIFLPAAGYRYDNVLSYDGVGYYWSSSFFLNGAAMYMHVDHVQVYGTVDTYCRRYGFSVRPVSE